MEFKGNIEHDLRIEFQYLIGNEINGIMIAVLLLCHTTEEIDRLREELVSNYLLTSIDKRINNIDLKLTKMELI